MAQQNPCCRCWLTSLHVIACVMAGFYAIWLLLHRKVHESCLASSPLYSIMANDAEIFVCDVALYACIVAVGWCLLAIVVVTACNFRKPLLAVQILVASVLGLLFLALSCVLTIDFIEWCDSISSCPHLTVCPPSDCLSASQFHDGFPNNSTMVNLYWNSAVGLVCMWTLSPAVITLALCYTASIWICRPKDPAPERPLCQGHCWDHAHSYPHVHGGGPMDSRDYGPPPSYNSYRANLSRVPFNPEPRPVERQAPLYSMAPVQRPEGAAEHRPREEDDVPLLIDFGGNENPWSPDQGGVAPATAPLSESGHAHDDGDDAPLLGAGAQGGGASHGRSSASKLI